MAVSIASVQDNEGWNLILLNPATARDYLTGAGGQSVPAGDPQGSYWREGVYMPNGNLFVSRACCSGFPVHNKSRLMWVVSPAGAMQHQVAIGFASLEHTSLSASGNGSWLLYLAGDNNLDSAGAVDIAELKRVGSNDEVNLLAQFDRAGARTKTMRYYLRKGTSLAKDAVQSLGETNMGDPKVLEDFLTWGLGRYPAQHYVVVLWNHGSGWDDTNVYVDGEAFGSTPPPVTRKGSLITGRGRRGAVPMAVARAGVKRARRASDYASAARRSTTSAKPGCSLIGVIQGWRTSASQHG
jgi:hypothetical protein